MKHNGIKMTNLYEETGKYAGLKGKNLTRYVAYMMTRWPKGIHDSIYNPEGRTSVDYALEWAKRFLGGVEFQYSDIEGQQILREIDEVLE